MKDKFLTVTALTKYIKHQLETDPHLQFVRVQGEISNFNYHSSGHMYFTIKDDTARISAVMFRGHNRQLKFTPENGMRIFITGKIGVFERFGQYQLYVETMQPDGIGELYLAFEQLRDQLQKKKYFDEQYKKPIEQFPENIAIVTSKTGAAIRDIVTTIKKRYPLVRLTIIPAIVQGEQSAPSIVSALKRANEGSFDTIILARGGGSIEDLWSFNEKIVAEAIFHSTIPVITGIGHETDLTISDLVADLRAPTPTGAAHYAVPSMEELQNKVIHLTHEIKRFTKTKVMQYKEQLKRLEGSYYLSYPKRSLLEKTQYVDRLFDQLQSKTFQRYQYKKDQYDEVNQTLEKRHPTNELLFLKQKNTYLRKQLKQKINILKDKKETNFVHLLNKLNLLNPLEIMQRGYSLTYDKNEKLITSIDHVHVEERIDIHFHDGKALCFVKEVNKKKHG